MALPAAAISSIGTGKTYTTLTAWEADLDDAQWGQDYTGEIYGLPEDAAGMYFSGIDANGNKCTLRCETDGEPDGTDNHASRLAYVVYHQEDTNALDFDLHGIEFAGAPFYIYSDASGSTINITKCFFRDYASSFIDISGTGTITVNIGVCLFVDGGNVDIYNRDADVTTKVLNCSGYSGVYGPYDSATFAAVTNDVFMEYSNADFGSAPANMSYCCSSDATAIGVGSVANKTYTDNWTDADGSDFTVKDTDADIYHSGVAIAGEAWFPGTDLVGTSWNDPPSMGCFEYDAGEEPPAAPPPSRRKPQAFEFSQVLKWTPLFAGMKVCDLIVRDPDMTRRKFVGLPDKHSDN